MNPTWSSLNPDALQPPSSVALEMPSMRLLPTDHRERADAFHSPAPFSLSPFHYSTGDERLPALAEDLPETEPDPEAERRLKSLRKSPGFALLSQSVLLLKACQLDMDLPPRRRHYLRARLSTLLQQLTGSGLDPDQLCMRFTTRDYPSVEDDGTERYTRMLSLTDVALARCDPARFAGLARATLNDAPLSEKHSSLTASSVFKLIHDASWAEDYAASLSKFWDRQRETYRTLCKLGFLDGLARQLARKKISGTGYALTLDAMGLRQFPCDLSALESSGRGNNTEVWGLLLNGERLPGIFQVRSSNTSHCFIHVIGSQGKVVEYISDDPEEMCRRLLCAMNESGWHRQLLHMLEPAGRAGARVQATRIDGDVFTALTRAQEGVSGALLADEQFDRLDLLKPLARALALASAVELWPSHAPVLSLIPEPSKSAARLMRDFLVSQCGLALNPDHVFVAYRRGTSTTPLGDPRAPSMHVQVPSPAPISLSQALMTHYRVESAAGYIDHGGRTVVFVDTSGKGEWSAANELPVNPQAIEDHIRQIDFLTTMSGYIHDFWNRRRDEIEQAFTSVFITQALIALKQSRLSRKGFDLVIRALAASGSVRWKALGFHVQGSPLEAMTAHYPGLLLLEQADEPAVLYQAGHAHAFLEMRDPAALRHHLRHAAKDERWRGSVLQYAPVRSHPRLDYLLKVWAGIQAPNQPASLLRPWTDALYNADTRKALHNSISERVLDGSPFDFLRQTLKQNALDDAQDQIVTAAEVTLRYWTSRLNQLQLLLAPMSVLLTPAFIASLATEIGVTSLNIAAAYLPGSRYEEKKNALLTTLSLGLLRLGPQTPRLLRSLGRITKPAGRSTRAVASSGETARTVGSLFRHSLSPRRTRLEKFFHTDAMLKRWTIASHPRFGTVSVHAWKLGRRFLLWTSDRGQARTLVVSTHGHYLPWSSTVRIPHGTELQTYAPHGYILVDPLLHRIVNRTVQPFAISNAAGNTLVQTRSALPPLLATDKLIAGTSLRGRLKNYTLSKFQSLRNETYEDIGHIVRNSNASPLRGQLPAAPMDILTVRNRFGMPCPSLADLFDSLYAQGIHYDRILLVHCRCAAIASMIGRAPVYHAPTLKPSIAGMADLAGQLADLNSDDITDRP